MSEHINNFPPLPKSMQQICPVPEHLPIQFYDLWSWFWSRHFLILAASSIRYCKEPCSIFFMIIPPKWPTIPLFIHFLCDVLDISQPCTVFWRGKHQATLLEQPDWELFYFEHITVTYHQGMTCKMPHKQETTMGEDLMSQYECCLVV